MENTIQATGGDGLIAIRTGRKFSFDPCSKRIIGDPFANALLSGTLPRRGWEEYHTLQR